MDADWLLWLVAAAFMIVPLFVQAAAHSHAMPAPDDPNVFELAWQVVRWVLAILIGLVVFIFQQTKNQMNERIEQLAEQIREVPEEDERRDRIMFASLERRMDDLERRNAMQHEDNRRRLERIENKIDRAYESIPNIINAAQRDIYEQLGELKKRGE